MTGVFLIIILAVVWYVAGIFHSFALMLYVAVNLLLIAGMYILTRIYKRNVVFDFDVNLAEGLKNSGCQLRINIGNKTGIPITKIRLNVVVSYCEKAPSYILLSTSGNIKIFIMLKGFIVQ